MLKITQVKMKAAWIKSVGADQKFHYNLQLNKSSRIYNEKDKKSRLVGIQSTR